MRLAMGECAHLVAVVINISVYYRVAGNMQFVPDNILVIILNRVQNDLVGAVANRAGVGVSGNVFYSEIGHTRNQ